MRVCVQNDVFLAESQRFEVPDRYPGLVQGYWGLGTSACKAAAVGHYAPNGTLQETCSAGTYQDQTGKTECNACNASSYQDGSHPTECVCTPMGYAATADRTNKVPCAAGTYADAVGSQGGTHTHEFPCHCTLRPLKVETRVSLNHIKTC